MPAETFDIAARRRRVVDEITRQPLDVLVVGGGIVGAGVARDAALRGLRTTLVDRFDFAFGTSSRSSRLLHGGLRYLAQGRIGLVREASLEKLTIGRIAPHLTLPLSFIFPTRGRTHWMKWKLSLGVKIYDLLCNSQNFGPSSSLSRLEVIAAIPQLNPSGLTGAVRYFDGMTNDARLVIDTLRSAEASGAVLLNYAPLEKAQRVGDLWQCAVTDTLAKSSFEIAARNVVNAAGAWASSLPASGVKLRLTKGVHLVIDTERLNLSDAVVMAQGKRILFALPWGQRTILGTTDTDYAGPLDSPTCDESDMRYILDVANFTFPYAKLSPADVISTFAGLRPLIASGNQTGQPSDISRAHQINMPQPGWFDVAGGKLTTHRLVAEQTVDRILDFSLLGGKPCQTASTPLLPGETPPPFSGILPPPVTREAVEHFVDNEWATNAEDIMLRRTSWRHYHRDCDSIAQQVADWMRVAAPA